MMNSEAGAPSDMAPFVGSMKRRWMSVLCFWFVKVVQDLELVVCMDARVPELAEESKWRVSSSLSEVV